MVENMVENVVENSVREVITIINFIGQRNYLNSEKNIVVYIIK